MPSYPTWSEDWKEKVVHRNRLFLVSPIPLHRVHLDSSLPPTGDTLVGFSLVGEGPCIDEGMFIFDPHEADSSYSQDLTGDSLETLIPQRQFIDAEGESSGVPQMPAIRNVPIQHQVEMLEVFMRNILFFI